MAARRITNLHGRRLRDELLSLRTEKGWTLAAVVEHAEGDFTDTTLSRWEVGESLPKATDLRRLLAVYGASPERTQELLGFLREAKENRRSQSVLGLRRFKSGFGDYLSLEPDATSIRTYQANVLPGLLQTREYATATTWSAVMVDSDDQALVSKVVDLRLARQQHLTSPGRASEFVAIVDESAICRLIGGPETTRAQLQHVLAMVSRANVTVRVQPFAAKADAALTSSEFTLLTFPEPHPPVVYTENVTSGVLSDEDALVAVYSKVWASLERTALDPDDSAKMLEAAIDNLERSER